jgi:protein-S-isoprenylcysteine O-methyltransferase Ste14
MLGAVVLAEPAESVVLILVVFSLFQTFYAIVTRHEERRLKAIFAQEFENYCQRVPRPVPCVVMNMSVSLRMFLAR